MTRAQALKYLRNHPTGTIEELTEKCGLNIVKGFELTGIIQRGQEADRVSSYEFTSEGKRIDTYVNLDDHYDPSFLDKIQNFFNKKTIDKNMLFV